MTKFSVDELVNSFSLDNVQLKRIADLFIKEAESGLENDGQPMTMIPTYVTAIPSGNEKGTLLAVDLGGTNFRVCSVNLNGDGTFGIVQSRVAISNELMVGTSNALFGFLAQQVKKFLKQHHEDHFAEDKGPEHVLKLGFTFSFPVNQTAINRGTLIRWTKGFDVKDAVGKDVCQLLQEQLDKLKLKVHVAALVNDTVGTLMSRAYCSPGKQETQMGVILGTGTNCAYVENLNAVTKIGAETVLKLSESSPMMIINTEWGSFDKGCLTIGQTLFDSILDSETLNKGYHMFEKHVSGMFLGELLRLALVELHTKCDFFASQHSDALFKPWKLDTSALSFIEADTSTDLDETEKFLLASLHLTSTLAERKSIKLVVDAIGKRSAHLAGAVIGALLLHTQSFEKMPQVDVGVDGSVFKFYPGYEKYIRESLRVVVGEQNEKRVAIGLAEDGSGVGAALCALVA
ncbi:hexokinase-domain-containing protein [Lipomyces oligophaga]|uniref:hexokinase-domain-containing protein n=1 Tax=Lipomyces oligophaga TaxID=45792 RepID=UPI0034CD5416